jgi:small subunit ribosomal protein S5
MEETKTTNPEVTASEKTQTRAPQGTRSATPRTGTSTAPRGRRPQTGGDRKSSGGPRKPGGARGGRNDRAERPKPEFDQKMIEIRRVTRVVAGGRRFSFSVTLVAGDKKGRVGVGIGKATDTTLAINKAFNDAKRNMIKIRTNENGSIPHEATAKYNSARVFLMPNKSRGVVVGSAMRTVVEFAGLTDITGRVVSGSKNKINIARATIKALQQFATPVGTRSTE